ncbi:hypothetical protein [Halohasta litorea]|uniref:Transmembrane protein n=1 Tax=Halohasta litorea TaxID=869891 RepID=A0ABD6D8V4_9EURY|nr:hypothetical protein [Halohasta litorea]MEA1931783.1 hypothetical protein [Euryarchaeota archaeon]
MEHRNFHIVGYGLALCGCLTIGISVVLSESPVGSEVAPFGVIILGGALALVLGLRNVLAKTRAEYDLEHSVAYRVANWGAAIIVVSSGLLLFAVGTASLVFG